MASALFMLKLDHGGPVSFSLEFTFVISGWSLERLQIFFLNSPVAPMGTLCPGPECLRLNSSLYFLTQSADHALVVNEADVINSLSLSEVLSRVARQPSGMASTSCEMLDIQCQCLLLVHIHIQSCNIY